LFFFVTFFLLFLQGNAYYYGDNPSLTGYVLIRPKLYEEKLFRMFEELRKEYEISHIPTYNNMKEMIKIWIKIEQELLYKWVIYI